jgi:hypothetical protein
MPSKIATIIIIALVVGAAGTGVFLFIWLTADPAPILKDKIECVFEAQSEKAMGKCLTNAFSSSYMFYLVNESRTYYGDFINVSVSLNPDANGRYSFNATFQWSTVSGTASLARFSRKINYFFINWFVYTQSYIDSISLGSIYTAFEGLPSNGSLLVARDNETLYTYNADKRLAVGSTFKLFVLHALVERIASSPATWDTTWPVQDKYKSLFTGGITSIPNGTPVTLRNYANLMINISDNSATDHLIYFLDRAYVESFLPSGYNLPLLTTAEMFKLKYLIDDFDLEAYLGLNEAGKRSYLDITIASLDVNDISPTTDWTHNMEDRQHVEWFFNSTEIYAIQNLTKGYSSTHMNWGLAWIGMTWPQVSYKGGSDVGVYAMAHTVQATNGSWYYVTFFANNYEEFQFLNYNVYVDGQIGYEATCMRLLRKLASL